MNSRIYDILLRLNDCEACNLHQLKREPLEIFNEAYAICDELQPDEHPELLGALIWDRLRDNDYLVCETNIIFSCVYVILTFSEAENRNMKHFFARFLHVIDTGYFKEFEPLIREELTYLTTPATNFEFLQTEGNKIQDLNQRELFYSGFLTHHKQAHCKGNIEQQVAEEIELIHITKELSEVENDNPNAVSNKVRAIVTMELLKKLGIDTAHFDLSKICRLVALIMGTGYSTMYADLRKGIRLTDYHGKEIDEVNKIFSELNISISIDKHHHT